MQNQDIFAILCFWEVREGGWFRTFCQYPTGNLKKYTVGDASLKTCQNVFNQRWQFEIDTNSGVVEFRICMVTYDR